LFAMIRFRKLIILGMLASSLTQGYAQKTLAKISVDVDPGSAAFVGDTGLPFDVPFNIRGPISDGLKKVTMTYFVNHYEASWMNKDDKCIKSATSWKNIGIAAKDNKFTLQIGAIYPNTSYTFNFNFFTAPTIDATKKTDLYKSLLTAIDNFIKSEDNTNIAVLNTVLNDKLKQAIGAELVDVDGQKYRLNVGDTEMKPVIDALLNTKHTVVTRAGNIYASIERFNSMKFTAIKNELAALSGDPSVLSSAAMDYWKSPVASQVADYKGTTMADVAKLLTSPDVVLSTIFDGSKKIDGTKLAASDQFNEASAKVIKNFLSILGNGTLTQKDSGADYFAANKRDIQDFAQYVQDIINDRAAIKAANDDRDKQVAAFPDVVATHFVMSSFQITDRSNPDVTAEDNAYIGLDFGFADVYKYDNQVFLYEGVNFYLVPINKNAPLSSIHGTWRQLAKRFSVHLGLTQNVMGTPNKLYAPLISGAGSIMLGAGFRLNRFIHVNYGEMFFYEKDINPVIDHQHLTVRPTFSLTFDLVSTKAIGAFLGKLGIK
jgi:hypothetical protein